MPEQARLAAAWVFVGPTGKRWRGFGVAVVPDGRQAPGRFPAINARNENDLHRRRWRSRIPWPKAAGRAQAFEFASMNFTASP